MFEREIYIKKVTDFLAVLAIAVKNRSILGLLDLNVIAETFFADFLNIVYNRKLKNLNVDRSIMPGIDLGDNENRIAYQVTSKKTSDKVQKTLDRFIKHELNKEYDTVNILILGEKQKSYKTIQTHNLGFSVKDNILDLDDVLREVNKLDTEKLKLLCDVIDRETNIHLGISNSARTLFTLPGTHRKNPYFTPKHEVTAALDSLRLGDTLLLCGPPGVGKTQHAVQYAHEKRQQYRMVLWASVESVQSLYQAITTLADIILPIAQMHYSTEEKILAFQDWLGTEPEWLLILDNADLVDVAREIERFIPSAHHGYVLITSQLADWTSAFRMERVDVWTEEQSSDFLAQRLPQCAADKDNLVRLGNELGGLPLALEHAAAYIAETSISAGEYLELLSRDRRSILKRRYRGMTDYRASITATWQVSVRRLGWLAHHILHYAACLSSEPIPRNIFSHLLSSTSEDFSYSRFELRQLRNALMPLDALNLALAELGRYSLITLSEDTFRLHPLLQHVVLDSARIRPWQTRYWKCRMSAMGQSDWSHAAGLWLYRAAHLLNTKDVLPVDYSNDAAALNMRTFITHLQSLSHKTASTTPDAANLFSGIAPLDGMLRWFEMQINWYQSGMSVLRELLESNANVSPNLTAETEWFLAHVEDLYKQVVVTSYGKNLTHNLRRLSGDGEWDVRRESYSFLRILACEHAKIGLLATARRLFKFYIAQAMADPEAPSDEVALARLQEVLSLLTHLPIDELRSRLEAVLVLYEGDVERFYFDVWRAILYYSMLAQTPDEESRALNWIKPALPKARKWLAYGCDHACGLTEEYVRILIDKDELDEALLACEETLRLALKSKKIVRNKSVRVLSRESVTTLWRQRGRLLRECQHFLASARSYARCLALELQYGEPTPFKQIDLHFVIGEMYLQAAMISAAKQYLLKAHDLLEIYWSDDSLSDKSLDAKDYAALIGFSLGQIHEDVKGEAMLRRALAQLYADSGTDGANSAWIHYFFAKFLRERGRFEEADSEMRRMIEILSLNTPSTESPGE